MTVKEQVERWTQIDAKELKRKVEEWTAKGVWWLMICHVHTLSGALQFVGGVVKCVRE